MYRTRGGRRRFANWLTPGLFLVLTVFRYSSLWIFFSCSYSLSICWVNSTHVDHYGSLEEKLYHHAFHQALKTGVDTIPLEGPFSFSWMEETHGADYGELLVSRSLHHLIFFSLRPFF